MSLNLSFDTTHYELRHGRSPRGRGAWVFCPFHERNTDSPTYLQAPGSMTLTNARKWAKNTILTRRYAAWAAGTLADPWDASLWCVCS